MPGNPFSTRYVRPGAMEYLFPPGESAEGLLDRLRADGWWGQIAGPHGSGKSTLLQTLLSRIHDAHVPIAAFRLHDGQRRLPTGFAELARLPSGAIVAVDGYEQLGYLVRYRLKRLCRRQGFGLLVTAHSPVGLPELWRSAPGIDTAHKLVQRLLAGDDRSATLQDVVTHADVERCHQACRGNMRETLFALYDLYEQRRRA